MARYLVRRVLLNVPIFFGVTIVVFIALHLAPGDPIGMLISPESGLSNEELDVLRQELGLDRPVPVQYILWLGQAAQGNLGYRTRNFEPVAQAIADRMAPTLMLMGTALIFGILVGVSLGVLAALQQYSWLDLLLSVLAYLGVSLPGFFLGLGALYLFALRLRWLPAGGMVGTGMVGTGTVDDVARHLILPALILSLSHVATMMRYTRSSMLEVLSSEYVRTAMAKGLPMPRVVVGHALRNALLPTVTVAGLAIPSLLGGSIIIEAIFSWPGLGQLYLDGVLSRDYPLIMGMTLATSTLVLFGNLLTDVSYAYLDPRIRYENT